MRVSKTLLSQMANLRDVDGAPPLAVRRTTDDENARSALECGRSYFHDSKRRSRGLLLRQRIVIWTSLTTDKPWIH